MARQGQQARFGKISPILLFGGGKAVADIAAWLSKRYDVTVFSGPRRANEVISGGRTFAQVLEKGKITLYTTEDINKSGLLGGQVEQTALGVLYGAPWDFDAGTIAKFNGRLVEITPIPLPRYRGGAHQTHQILRNDVEWGSSIQLVTPEKHKGPLLMEAKYRMKSGASPEELQEEVAEKSAELFREFLKKVENGETFGLKEIDEADSMSFPFLNTAKQGFIDWSWTAGEIEAFVNAFGDPYKGASTFIGGKRVYLKKCSQSTKDGHFHPFQAGIVYRKANGAIYVAARGGALQFREARDEDGKDALGMIKENSRLHTPSKVLEEARTFGAEYDAKGLKKGTK